MASLIDMFSTNGLLTLFAGLLLQKLGAPVPALPLLLLAGARAAGDGPFGLEAFGLAVLASMLGDSAWFLAGRRFGRGVLSLMCRISISPDTCVRQSELSFARRGTATLVIAKFVPGLSLLAPPLAGALGMRLGRFAVFSLAGSALWTGGGMAAGLLLHRQITQGIRWLTDFGGVSVAVMAGALCAYVAWRIWRRRRVLRQLATLERISPENLARMIDEGRTVAILDVRAAADGQSGGQRIPGALHLDLASLAHADLDRWPDKVEIVTYCDCPNDVSAARAAHALGQRLMPSKVLDGGIAAWVRAGYALESIH